VIFYNYSVDGKLEVLYLDPESSDPSKALYNGCVTGLEIDILLFK
jgi:hypothetical protein